MALRGAIFGIVGTSTSLGNEFLTELLQSHGAKLVPTYERCSHLLVLPGHDKGKVKRRLAVDSDLSTVTEETLLAMVGLDSSGYDHQGLTESQSDECGDDDLDSTPSPATAAAAAIVTPPPQKKRTSTRKRAVSSCLIRESTSKVKTLRVGVKKARTCTNK